MLTVENVDQVVIFDSDRLFSRKNEQFLRRLFRGIPKCAQKIIVSDGLSKTPESAMGFSKTSYDKKPIEISSFSIDIFPWGKIYRNSKQIGNELSFDRHTNLRSFLFLKRRFGVRIREALGSLLY